jgi:hypothetical protein
VPSKIYPGYSADFFDGKHYIVVRVCRLSCMCDADGPDWRIVRYGANHCRPKELCQLVPGQLSILLYRRASRL